MILYADKVTRLDAAGDRRDATAAARSQIAYNEEHGITPQTIQKGVSDIAEFLSLDRSTNVPRPPARGAKPARA